MDQAGGDVEEPVAQGLRFAEGERSSVADAAQQAGPGGQVGRDHGQRQPGLVDRELPRREPAQAGVLHAAEGSAQVAQHPAVDPDDAAVEARREAVG